MLTVGWPQRWSTGIAQIEDCKGTTCLMSMVMYSIQGFLVPKETGSVTTPTCLIFFPLKLLGALSALLVVFCHSPSSQRLTKIVFLLGSHYR
jgi:hypothetical protein